MKKYIKNKTEKEKLALGILDTIDDSYISEALELHMAIVDSPETARSPKLFMKRIAIVAACFLVVLAIIPVVLIVSPSFDTGGNEFDPSFPEQSMPLDNLLDGILSDNALDVAHIVLSPGEGVEIAIGRLEFVSCADGVFTFRIFALIEYAPRILLAAEVDGVTYYSLNFGGEYAGNRVENGFTPELIQEDGDTLLLVNASAFVAESGAAPDSLRMVIGIDRDVIGIIPNEK